jgi:hypothetical protein
MKICLSKCLTEGEKKTFLMYSGEVFNYFYDVVYGSLLFLSVVVDLK